MLGEQGAKRLRQAGKIEIDVPKAVRLTSDSLFAAIPDSELPSEVAKVAERRDRVASASGELLGAAIQLISWCFLWTILFAHLRISVGVQ